MQSKPKAFTLIELIVVIVIIGILGSVAVPSYTNFVKQSKENTNKNLAKDLLGALDNFYMECGTYPFYGTPPAEAYSYGDYGYSGDVSCSDVMIHFIGKTYQTVPMNSFCSDPSNDKIRNQSWSYANSNKSTVPPNTYYWLYYVSGIIINGSGSMGDYMVNSVQIDEAAANQTGC